MDYLFLLMYVVSAVLIYGMTLAHCEAIDPSRSEADWAENKGFSALLALFASFFPIGGLLVVFLLYGFAHHGLLYTRPKNQFRQY